MKFLGLITWIYYRSIWFNSNWQHFQPCYLSLYFRLVRYAYKTFISHTNFRPAFTKDKYFPSSKLEGSLLIPQQWEGAVRGFSTAFLATSANREERRWGTIPVSLTLTLRFCSAPAGWILFLNPVQTDHMEMGDRVCEGATKGRKAWKHSCCLECEGCAQHRQESSAWKVQLKEATPALSKREKGSTASSELPEQQRRQRNNSLGYGTQTMFGNSHMRERGDLPADLLGNWGWSWQFGWNQEHNKMQKRGLKLGIPLFAPLTASQEQGCSNSQSKQNSGPFSQSEWPRKR